MCPRDHRGTGCRLLQRICSPGRAAAARRELAADFLADLRRLDIQRHDTRRKLATAVAVSGTTLAEIFGIGPVIAPPSSTPSPGSPVR
jgi:hypothetical protein